MEQQQDQEGYNPKLTPASYGGQNKEDGRQADETIGKTGRCTSDTAIAGRGIFQQLKASQWPSVCDLCRHLRYGTSILGPAS